MLERDRRREWSQPRRAGQDLATIRRVGLDQLAFAAIESARLLHDFQRDARLPDVVQERRLDEGDDQLPIEPDLPPDEEAEHRHVDRVTPGQVLILFHRQHMA